MSNIDKKKTRELTFLNEGILGFEKLTQFSLQAYDEKTPFYTLQSLEDEDAQFIVMEPGVLIENYEFDLSTEEAEALSIEASTDAFVLVLLTIPEDPALMTANLLGPLIFNQTTHMGKQIILKDSHYPVQFPLFPEGIAQGDPS